MRAESEGRLDEARGLYEQAWAEHTTDYEACIAAHYLARQQAGLADEFRWNQLALERAARVDPELVRAFYASLHLNMGHSYEKQGDHREALDHFRAAQRHLEDVPEGPYKEIVRNGIESALSRTGEGPRPFVET